MFGLGRAPLVDCDPPDLAGRVRREDPAVEVLRDAVFVPRALGLGDLDDARWGLYRRDGALCAAAAERRGPAGELAGQAPITPLRPSALPRAPDALYVYAGLMHVHFGHFLLSSLARLWTGLSPRADVRLLIQAEPPVRERIDHPFIRDILAALRIAPEQLAVFDEPLRLGEVLVPAPAFGEDAFAHMAAGELGARVGAGLIGAPPPRGDAPVYLSRSRLPTGIARVVNEAPFEAELARRGVRVVHPETLPLAEQVRVLEEARTVLSLTGSALHTTLLVQRPLRLRALCMTPQVVLNYPLVDAVKRHDARYLRPPDARFHGAAPADFHIDWELADPRATARAFLDASLA